MLDLNKVQTAIKSLGAGSFQKFMDAYLIKKYNFNKIVPLGVQDETEKTTKGTPDSYVYCENGKYILILHGSVKDKPIQKIKEDILSCFKTNLLNLPPEKIAKIICTTITTNITIQQYEELKNISNGTKIEIIDLGTVSNDVILKYPVLATRFLNIPLDTNQVFDIEDFIDDYDAGGMNAPLKIEFVAREEELKNLKESILNNDLTLVSGASGIGKTKLVIEACKQLRREENINVICINNKGLQLYEEIVEKIGNEGYYLIFIDDANQTKNLTSIYEYLISKNKGDNITIKIVMTVRDYVKESILNLELIKVKFKEIELKPLHNKDILFVLENYLSVKNEIYQKQIIKIAKGNIRLAVFAAISAKKDGIQSISNAIDIFKNFYNPVFNENKLSKKELIVLLVLSIFGVVRGTPNSGMIQLLNDKNISESEFKEICYKLSNYEFINIYENTIISISDQSFSNYILYYGLIEKKFVSIKELLLKTFPTYSEKIIETLNTILQLFNGNLIIEYIENQINEAWNHCDKKDEKRYVESFYRINELKALNFIKNKIKEQDDVSYVLDISNFKENCRSVYKRNTMIEILTSFKNTKYFNIAIDLLIEYFSKNPNIGYELFVNIENRIRIDKFSIESNFEDQKYLINAFLNKYKTSKNENFSIMLINIIGMMLETEYHKTEEGILPNSFNYVTYKLVYSDNLIEFRNKLWLLLKEFRKNKLLEKEVDNIIASLHVGSNEETKKIFVSDVSIIKKMFDEGNNILSFSFCIAIGELIKKLNWLEIKDIELEELLCRNKEFCIYKKLVYYSFNYKIRNEEEEKKRIEIREMIVDYDYEEYLMLFAILKKCELLKVRNEWDLYESVDIIFENIETNIEKFILAIKAYFTNSTPYVKSFNDKMHMIIKVIGSKKAKELLNILDSSLKPFWESAYYSELPESDINNSELHSFHEFINSQRVSSKICLPNIYDLEKYRIKDIDICHKIIDLLLQNKTNNPNLIVNFFGIIIEQTKVEYVLAFFKDDLEKLHELYMEAIKMDHFDYDGNLLIELIKDDLNFYTKIVKLNSENSKCILDKSIFNKIWMLDNYTKMINIAYENIRNDHYLMYGKKVETIFSFENDTNDVKCRKVRWLKEYIQNHSNNKKNMKDVFSVISTEIPERRIEFIVEFLKYNNDFDSFNRIPIFPLSQSWSGSEIPLIEDDIQFLEALSEEIKGIDYLEHIAYINEWINHKKNHKKKVLEDEYIESFNNY